MKKSLFKILAMVMCLTILAVSFAACSKDENSTKDNGSSSNTVKVEERPAIVGEWGYEDNEEWKYIFNEDGTGSYVFGAEPLTFTYEDDGEVLKIKYDNSDNVNEFKYVINSDTLSIEDSFGETVKYIKQ